MICDHDRHIRPHLLAYLAPRASWVCEEFSADGKVDVATVESGLFCGYEIKATKDTLKRLGLATGAQVFMFSRTFDRVTLVCAEKHLAKATILIPPWWGITLVGPEAFSVVREATDNPEDPTFRITQMLWQVEAMAVLRAHGLHRGVAAFNSVSRHGEIMRRIGTLPREVVRDAVFSALRSRDWSRDGRRQRVPTDNRIETASEPVR